MSKRARWYVLGAFILGLGAAAAVWLQGGAPLGERSPRVPLASVTSAKSRSPSSGDSRLKPPAVDPLRALATAAKAPANATLARAAPKLDAPDRPVAPAPWRRPMQPSSKKWAQDPRLAELNQAVEEELVQIESWYQQHRPLASWSEVGPERLERVAGHSAELGQRVVSGECRVGVCRLEVEHDPKSPKHARVRPEPRVRRHADGSVMVRRMVGDSIQTIFFLVEEPLATR